MLWVTRRNSMRNGPTVTVCRGLDRRQPVAGVDAVFVEFRLDSASVNGEP